MKVFNWIIALLGLWEAGDIAALLTPGFGAIRIFVWNHILVGVILMVAGVWAALISQAGTAKKLDWIAALAGGWLVIATLLLRNPVLAVGFWNDIIVGVLVSILAVWTALAAPRRAG